MKALQRPDAIFLDWDGTLVDSFAFLLAAHNHVRGILGLEPFTPAQFTEHFGQPREMLYKVLYGNRGEEAKKHFETFVLTNHLKHLKAMDSAGTLVRTIYDMKIKSGVVSNKRGPFVRAEIDHLGWTPMFHAVVGAGEAPQDKPAADPLLLARSLAKVEGNPVNTWYVGDSETDAQCARNAGCTLVIIEHSNISTGWIRDFKPALVIKNCAELNDFLLQWRKN